ncbi:MAG: ketose-bisphosphate aldolase [Defluviitaleaceae bacterium]|nr:ketose-bisphosphate aldolase [Defluviitaleaceae bacterium]
MALVSMKSILHHAQTEHYGVGAFNLLNMEAVKGAIAAAEELNSPIILQLAEVQLPHTPMHLMFPMMLQAAREASVPVAVHYDHGITFEAIMQSLKYGVGSVMYDGAALPFDENVQLSAEIVRIAHAMGADVEAELGVVGGTEAGGHEDINECLTDPAQAHEFVKRTGCDFLAVAIGNAHGPYVKKPDLQMDRLKQINEAVQVPLVLHGGSGISDDDFKTCIKHGITKINVATSLQERVLATIDASNYVNFTQKMEMAVFEDVAKHMKIFGSIGRGRI